MLRRYSLQKLLPPDWRGFPLDYLHELPFPLADPAAHRAKVCDDCFFGGPTKDEPVIPMT